MTDHSNEDLIIKRYSCRSYKDAALSEADIRALKTMISSGLTGPFGTEMRFAVTAAAAGDSSMLKGLGTYGVIRHPAAFIIGAVKKSGMYLEDFGYAMEKIILGATAMNLGTCWLGGTFRKSRFAARIAGQENESVPAVVSVGYIPEHDPASHAGAAAKKRFPFGSLFFDETMTPLMLQSGDLYGKALETVRLAPSATNRQPWRIVKDSGRNIFRFYLTRTSLYLPVGRFLGIEDMQRIDMGIAMCHFELTAGENHLGGSWKVEPAPAINVPKGWQYTATWFGD